MAPGERGVYTKSLQDETTALEYYYSIGIGYENLFSKVLLLRPMRPHVHLFSNYLTSAYYMSGEIKAWRKQQWTWAIA